MELKSSTQSRSLQNPSMSQQPQVFRPQTPGIRPVQTVNPQPVNSPIQTRPVLRPMVQEMNKQTSEKGSSMNKKPLFILLALVVILFGTGTGYVLAAKTNATTPGGLKDEPGLQREVTGSDIKVGTKVGVADERTFKDSSEGTLQKGGIDGEGSHHIVRPGGESQTLYITSSIIDLDQFINRKVKVWGETLGAQKAGWLMDVGKLEVLE